MLPKKINHWYDVDYQRKHNQYAREHNARLADAIRAATGTQFVTPKPTGATSANSAGRAYGRR